VALKILAPAAAADEAFRRRFIRESRAAAAVDDPHIIPVFEAGEADGVLFLAMRYVPGGDAHSLVRRIGPLSPSRAAAIVSSMASALDAAHAAGLVHRDVKPANMLVDARPGRPDHVYLADFGLSKGALSSHGLTASGQFLGTPGYCAPEQMQGSPTDGRADQYSLACVAFELLSGAPPFPRDQVTAVIWAHMSEPPPLLTSRRPGLPAAVDGVVARALAKTPTSRYASCREFADALRAALRLEPYNSGSGRAHLRTQTRPHANSGDWRPAAAPGTGHAEDDGGHAAHEAARHRWPVVTTILAVLLVVIVGCLYAAWQYTQSQYYVGSDGQQVIIYRGVNQRVLGISLSSVYQATGIPLGHVPSSDRLELNSTIPASDPTSAQKTVNSIRQAWTCDQYALSYASWVRHKPKPVKTTVNVHGKIETRTYTPPYRPAPKAPKGCPPQRAAG
jgi:Protein kinase domain